jgi:hypothetical protein
MKNKLSDIKPIHIQLRRQKLPTIPNKNIMDSAATRDNPAPDNDASVKSLGIFLQTEKNKWLKQTHKISL